MHQRTRTIPTNMQNAMSMHKPVPVVTSKSTSLRSLIECTSTWSQMPFSLRKKLKSFLQAETHEHLSFLHLFTSSHCFAHPLHFLNMNNNKTHNAPPRFAVNPRRPGLPGALGAVANVAENSAAQCHRRHWAGRPGRFGRFGGSEMKTSKLFWKI